MGLDLKEIGFSLLSQPHKAIARDGLMYTWNTKKRECTFACTRARARVRRARQLSARRFAVSAETVHARSRSPASFIHEDITLHIQELPTDCFKFPRDHRCFCTKNTVFEAQCGAGRRWSAQINSPETKPDTQATVPLPIFIIFHHPLHLALPRLACSPFIIPQTP
jgi:hypothetical protein